MNKQLTIYFKLSIVAILAIVLSCCSILALAAEEKFPSPTKDTEYTLVVYPSKGGTGEKTRIKKNLYKINANEKSGYTFSYWKIKGKYVIQKGKLNTKKLTLRLRSDCEATPYFKAKQGVDDTPIKIDKSSVSPKTMDIEPVTLGNTDRTPEDIMYAVLGMIMFFSVTLIVSIASGGIYYCIKKLKEKNNS